MATDADLELLHDGDLTVLGQIADASNCAALVELRPAGSPPDVPARARGIYKPVRGERPLWDFPDGCLAHREVAAYLISDTGGFGHVPPTVLRDGPFGTGSVQRWVDAVGEVEEPVDLFAPDDLPDGWLPVMRGLSPGDAPVVVAHEDALDLAELAVLDVVLNNSDRKGAHILRVDGRLSAFDHGVSLHTDPKLRTVLWGWAGSDLPTGALEKVARVQTGLQTGGDLAGRLEPLLTRAEVDALRRRCEALVGEPRFPVPTGDWPAVPWPPL